MVLIRGRMEDYPGRAHWLMTCDWQLISQCFHPTLCDIWALKATMVATKMLHQTFTLNVSTSNAQKPCSLLKCGFTGINGLLVYIKPNFISGAVVCSLHFCFRTVLLLFSSWEFFCLSSFLSPWFYEGEAHLEKADVTLFPFTNQSSNI